jgi:cysteine-rich repeat protein
MRCCGLVLVVLACGCLDKNPLFVDPTDIGGATLEGTTTTPVTSDPGPTTDDPTIDPTDDPTNDPTNDPTDNAGSTLSEETTGPSTTFDTTDTEFPVMCGDGVHAYGIEECDDGNMVDDDDCGNDCKLPECGDLVIEGPEQCEDGNKDDTDDCPGNCMTAQCGDGYHWNGVEMCDDGNDLNDDACLSDCVVATCGDGFVNQGAEDCDDGNDVNGDECEDICKWSEKVIFVTSGVYTGNMNGLVGADGICQAHADEGSVPPGMYRAWLSDEVESASTRLVNHPGPYILAGGPKVVVAMNWADLTDGSLLAPIERTEYLGPPPPTQGCSMNGVHTNTIGNGKAWDLDPMAGCGNWKSEAGTTVWGSTKEFGIGWTEDCGGDLCGLSAPIYCVQQ